MVTCSYSPEEAKKLIDGADQTLVASGAIVVKVEKDMKTIKQRSKDNIKRLSLLL
jgi:hypothetical protein